MQTESKAKPNAQKPFPLSSQIHIKNEDEVSWVHTVTQRDQTKSQSEPQPKAKAKAKSINKSQSQTECKKAIFSIITNSHQAHRCGFRSS